MSQLPHHTDALFDRTLRSRSGHPFCGRVGAARRWIMFLVLVILVGIIGGYLYLTESRRVRTMTESYLASLLGAHVDMSSVTLSLFEGLRLDDVVVRVDKTSSSPDAVVFSAQAFIINYDPAMLLRGQLRATRIVAVNPHVRLTENLDDKTWNYQKLFKNRRAGATRPTSIPPDRPDVLPEILLRDALIDYAEISHGQYRSVGSIAVEGQLTPATEAGQYNFDVRSRGLAEATGPVVTGTFDLDDNTVSASLRNFKFGRDLKSMLPAQVRQWCDDHQLDGRLDVRELSYRAGKTPGETSFVVETQLDGVTLAVNPLEMTGTKRADVLRDTVGLLDLTLPYTPGLLDRIETLREPVPIRLRKVAGTFVFTETGIEIKDVLGQVENNWMRVNGRVGGYTPDAPFDISLSSLSSENLVIPQSPRYVRGLPQQVREIYDRLRPQGTCRLNMRMFRTEPGGRPEVSGEIDVVDGNFAFELFPYPITHATGKIIFGKDPVTHMDLLRIDGVRGSGVVGGVNEKADIFVDGTITPLDELAGVNIRVRGENVRSEPALVGSFPPGVRESLKVFDPEGHGRYPTFAGRFECDILRPIGWRMPWTINVDIDITKAAGRLVPFPYPLEDLSARLEIREGYVDIKHAAMKRGDASLVFDGRVRWGKKADPVRTDLTITARNTPVDQDLIDALPPAQRAWLTAAGLKGTIDIDGKLWPRELGKNQIETDYQFDVGLHNGTAFPVNGRATVGELAGNLRLTPQKLQILQLTGRRGESKLVSSGTVAWPNDQLGLDLTTTATALELDKTLYEALPKSAQTAWDGVRPHGTVDTKLVVKSDPAPPGRPQPPPRFELTLNPQKLGVTLDALPVKLDDVRGTVVVTPETVTLTDVTARRGDARIKATGTGTLGSAGQWDIKVSGQDVAVDPELIHALPVSLGDVLKSMELKGKVAFDFSKLIYRPIPEIIPAVGPLASLDGPPLPMKGAPTADLDFAVKVSTKAAAMSVGVPLAEVDGSIALDGTVRQGRVSELNGLVNVASMKLAGREAKDFSATLTKPLDLPALQFSKMQGTLAGGTLAGQVDVVYPDDGPARYAMNLVLHEADIKELAGPSEKNVSGQLNASLALEGNWTDAKSRRGRGDVQVEGKEMYRIPVVLGLLEIANLALPVNSPFSEGSLRYGLEGERITFEQIALRSQNMLMQGNGYLDFGSRAVRMNFTTDNPNWPKLPFIGDLIQGARSELLQIHVRGTIQDPKVSAGTFNTFTTTVDEVMKGEGK